MLRHLRDAGPLSNDNDNKHVNANDSNTTMIINISIIIIIIIIDIIVIIIGTLGCIHPAESRRRNYRQHTGVCLKENTPQEKQASGKI